jgi:hypothetical protein
MKRMIGALLLAGLAMPVAADTAELNAEAKGIVKGFMGELKDELQAAMKAGGPVNAIEVCNRVAPSIAEKRSAQSGWQVARTSLKLRNGGNAPDPWERAALERFESRKAAGEPVEPMAYSEVVEEDGGQVFRFVKAIPTGEVCLKCHGGALAPEVQSQLDKLYPDDQARGYDLGDIRGAFTLKRQL